MQFEVPLLHYFQRKNEYSGAKQGMRYFFSPIDDAVLDEEGNPVLDEKGEAKKCKKLALTIWPDPWALNRTDPSLRMVNKYPFTEEGRTAAIAWLGECYAAEPERWQNCPSILDCEPWYPAPEPEAEAE